MDNGNCTSIERLQELDHLFRKLVRKFVKERDKFTIEGISLPGFMIMRKVLTAGEQRLSDLAEELDLSSGAITAQCDKLEAGGYAERTRYKEDRRTIYLNITEQGRAFLDRYERIGAINIDVIFAGLSDDEVTAQLDVFRKLIHNVEGLSQKILIAIHENENAAVAAAKKTHVMQAAQLSNDVHVERKLDHPTAFSEKTEAKHNASDSYLSY